MVCAERIELEAALQGLDGGRDGRGTVAELGLDPPGVAVEAELTAETLKLSYIRSVKARRFKNALIATVIAYAVMLAAFFVLGRCAF